MGCERENSLRGGFIVMNNILYNFIFELFLVIFILMEIFDFLLVIYFLRVFLN